ncbi:MAG: hypothetical protein EHM64_08305 [Ignavibacteriae bacterium]|nr:MAG: hypothetical protein EHM64_08305 [Ignavibacteriota bacterium]
MKRNIIFVLFIISFISQPIYSQISFHGTTLVVVRNKDSVIIGSDSKVGTINNFITLADFLHALPPSIEKIRISGNVAYVIGGLYNSIVRDTRSESETNNFDVFEIAESAFNIDNNIFQKCANFRINLRPQLEAIWDGEIKKNPITNLKRFAVVLIAGGIYHDIPYVIIESFYPKELKGIFGTYIHIPEAVVTEKRYPFANAIDSTCCFTFGAALENVPLDSYKQLLVTDPIAYVRILIELAVQKDSVSNGNPVKILCITRDGMNWIQ